MIWPTVPLNRVADLESGFGFPRDHQGDSEQEFPFFRVSDMNLGGNDVLMANNTNTVSAGKLKELGARAFPAGTIIFPKIGAAIATEKKRILAKPATYDNNVMGAVPKNTVNPRFLYYWFLRLRLTDFANPGHVPSICKSVMEQIPIALPVPGEQVRIVELLDEADRLRHLRCKADAKAARILPALFLKKFGDPATNPRGWPRSSLESVAEIISGATKGRRFNGAETVELPYMRVANVKDGYLDLTSIKTITVRADEVEKYLLQPGDLLMTEGGDPDKLGRTAIWGGEIRTCLHQNHIFKVRARREMVLPEYLRELVGSSYGKTYFLGVAKKTTGIATINRTQLGGFPVLIPPLSLQQDFAEAFSRLSVLGSQQAAAAQRTELLYSELLACAFSGKLTAKWREAHMKELLEELEQQARLLNLPLSKELEAAQ
jgi:type I restriction enzyme, S subunit